MHLSLLLMLLMLFPRYWKLWTASNILFPIRKSPAFLLCSWVDITTYLVSFSFFTLALTQRNSASLNALYHELIPLPFSDIGTNEDSTYPCKRCSPNLLCCVSCSMITYFFCLNVHFTQKNQVIIATALNTQRTIHTENIR